MSEKNFDLHFDRVRGCASNVFAILSGQFLSFDDLDHPRTITLTMSDLYRSAIMAKLPKLPDEDEDEMDEEEENDDLGSLPSMPPPSS